MTPNQLAYLLLANPDFAKQAGVMDWVKQKAAPLALAGSMGLAGGAAGSQLNQAITSPQKVQPTAVTAQPQPGNTVTELDRWLSEMDKRLPPKTPVTPPTNEQIQEWLRTGQRLPGQR